MMKNRWIFILLGCGLILTSCAKKSPQGQEDAAAGGKDSSAPCCAPAAKSAESTAPAPTPPAAVSEPAAPPAAATPTPAPEPAAPAAEELVPIDIKLPKPMFVGTPANLEGVANLEPPLGKARPPFLAPKGVANVALNKPVSSSETMPFMGELRMIVDGDKEATDGSVVELGPMAQHITIDLEQEYTIYAIVVWHFHRTPTVYFDVVVQISKDPDFIDAVTVFNNDTDNTLGLGVGTDKNYVETAEGKLIDAKGTKGRYVRLWSRGNNQNDYNHYIEVEVYGK